MLSKPQIFGCLYSKWKDSIQQAHRLFVCFLLIQYNMTIAKYFYIKAMNVSITYKQLQEFQDPLVCENIQGIACHWVNDGQPMDFVFDEWVDGIEQAARHEHR